MTVAFEFLTSWVLGSDGEPWSVVVVIRVVIGGGVVSTDAERQLQHTEASSNNLDIWTY